MPSPCPKWPRCRGAACTPPRRCWSAPAPPSAAPTPTRRPAVADPFEALRLRPEPVAPDPAFAAELRSRIVRALSRPGGATVTATAATNLPTAATTSRHGGVTPYIAVADARRALDWYAEALGARRRGDP